MNKHADCRNKSGDPAVSHFIDPLAGSGEVRFLKIPFLSLNELILWTPGLKVFNEIFILKQPQL